MDESLRTLEFDRTDLRLLTLLQHDASLSNVELARRVHLSPSQCQRRVRRLEQAGAIRGYVALLDPARIGLGVSAFVTITLERHGDAPGDAFADHVAGHASILDCWAVTGEGDYLLRVVARDLQAFSDLLLQELLRLPQVASVKSTLLLKAIKSTTALPLPG